MSAPPKRSIPEPDLLPDVRMLLNWRPSWPISRSAWPRSSKPKSLASYVVSRPSP